MADASFWSNDAKMSTQRAVVTSVAGTTIDGADVILVCVKPRFMGGGAATVAFRDVADSKDRIVADMTGSERTTVTRDPD